MKTFRIGITVLLAGLCCAAAWALPVRVITTGDMHGWVTGKQSDSDILGGTAEMLDYWRKVEGYRPEKFLLLSAGDNTTGPAISTAFKGDPAIAIMNMMGYDASAVGNHEFDFTLSQFQTWRRNAKFPFVTANIFRKDGKPLDIAAPYVINTEQGVKVAVIGLTTLELLSSTNYANDYIVKLYLEALLSTVLEAKAAGAQVIVVLAHVPQDDLVKLAGEVKLLGIPLMIGGHSHEMAQRKVGDTWVVNSGSYWQSYTRIDMDYNPATSKTTVLSSRQVWLQQPKPTADKQVSQEIGTWMKKMDAQYGAVVGYTAAGLKAVPDLYNLVTDSWMAADGEADFAVTNYGSMRQDIPPGEVKKAVVLSVMPFTNSLLLVKVKGTDFINYAKGQKLAGLSGIRNEGEKYILAKTGAPPEDAKVYNILMTNFMYDTCAVFAAADPSPKLVSEDWRTPLLDWFQKNPTSKEKPIEAVMDKNPRMQIEDAKY